MRRKCARPLMVQNLIKNLRNLCSHNRPMEDCEVKGKKKSTSWINPFAKGSKSSDEQGA